MRQTDWKTLKAHPAAETLPFMSEEEYAGLVKSIQTNGYDQSQPIVLFEGLILDGRNRHRACMELDQKGLLKQAPSTTLYLGTDVGGYVAQMNLHRRHLTEAQKAAFAMRLKPFMAAEAKERQVASLKQGGPGRGHKNRAGSTDPARFSEPARGENITRQRLAAVAGVSESTIKRLERVEKHGGEEALQKVCSGELSAREAERSVAPTKKSSNIDKPKSPKVMELEELERLIADDFEGFMLVSSALKEIRDRCLYIEQYGEFKRYIRQRWNIRAHDTDTSVLGVDVRGNTF